MKSKFPCALSESFHPVSHSIQVRTGKNASLEASVFTWLFVNFERQISFSRAHAALANEGQPALEGLQARGWEPKTAVQ